MTSVNFSLNIGTSIYDWTVYPMNDILEEVKPAEIQPILPAEIQPSETTRKLATIRRVSAIEPIEKADLLELAKIDGWQCVVKKGEFQPGDLAVYFEIDSFLPVDERYEFLRKACFRSSKHNGDGFRIKTVKLRGALSQGLLLPVSDFLFLAAPEEGQDVTGALNVKKWEVPLAPELSGVAKGRLPSFFPKTDQERLQNIFNKMQREYGDKTFWATLKMDGSSMSVFYKDGEVGVCSRNLEIKEDDNNTFWKVAKRHLIPILQHLKVNVAIQGELMGPGIQGNREKLEDHQIFIFDVYDIDRQTYMSNPEVCDFAFKIGFAAGELQLSAMPRFVDSLGVLKPFENYATMEDFLAASDIASFNNPIAEGVVYRCLEDPSVSFKVINNKFLLKEEQ